MEEAPRSKLVTLLTLLTLLTLFTLLTLLSTNYVIQIWGLERPPPPPCNIVIIWVDLFGKGREIYGTALTNPCNNFNNST